MPHIYDKSFKYTPAGKTDVKKTIARIRREMEAKQKEEQAKQEAAAKTSIKLWRTA